LIHRSIDAIDPTRSFAMRPRTRTAPGRRSASLALIVLIAATVGGTSDRAEEPALATPPHQAEPWTPPRTSLPKFLVAATATLCEQGLSDPRGCDYRTIQIAVGSVWGGSAQNLTTHGWVLPAAGGGKSRHAIAWSGLVYPLAEVRGPADLDADVRALGEAAGPGRADVAPKDRPARQSTFDQLGTNHEGASVAVASVHPIKVCLLLRLGRADLAEAVWAVRTGRRVDPKPGRSGTKLDLNSYGISYLSLARDLAWYHFDRAICAHMRSDDCLALADVRALDALALAVDARAEAMGFARPERRVAPGQLAPYIEFLDQLPEFRDDQERRARERANPPPPVRGEGRRARIAALIRDLDQVAVRQWGQPGGVVLGESPIIQDLIAQGEAAVEPLIRALRFDDRLTRSIGFGRDFRRGRSILRADQAAYTALTGILQTTSFAPQDPSQAGHRPLNRETLANQVQAYWERNRALPLVERWYQALADETAGDAAWLEAAGNIIQPENVQTIPGGGPFVVTRTTPAKPGERPRFRGESLREDHEPTVAALMARRVESMLKTPQGQPFDLLGSCRMAGMLAAWDPVAAVPTLRMLTPICRRRYARPDNGHDWANQNLAVTIARFTLARDQAGDAAAVREYAEWIRTTSPDWLDAKAPAVLEPLHRRSDDPSLAAAAAWLFGDPQSPWFPRIGRVGSRPTFYVSELIATPMVEVPAFRKMLRAGLDDRSPVGKAELGDDGVVNLQFDNGSSMTWNAPKLDRDPPARGTAVPIRMCDLFACLVTTMPGAPAFHPCWPEARRDAGLAALADFLRRKGM
jgi:hypothetical protein